MLFQYQASENITAEQLPVKLIEKYLPFGEWVKESVPFILMVKSFFCLYLCSYVAVGSWAWASGCQCHKETSPHFLLAFHLFQLPT